MKRRAKALKRRLLKIAACLGAGILLFFTGYTIAGQIAAPPETQLIESLPTLLAEQESVVQGPEMLADPAGALAWLLENLIATEPTLSVEQSTRVITNPQISWKQVRLKGGTCDVKALTEVLESSRKALIQDFNYLLLVNSDPSRGNLNFLMIDGFEAVVIANFVVVDFKSPVEPESNRPQLAIVIDDLGRSLESAENFASLPMSLTFAVFPKLYNSCKVARYFIDRKCDILLHMPMEPRDYPAQDPGPGALFRGMSETQIRRVFVECLEFLPGIIGVNNHMGSCLTADEQKMAQVMDILKGRNLFFLDSRTIANSVAYKSAIAAGIPALQRDVFLDNDRDVDEIVEQLQVLIEIAKIKRSAIGIGHPYPETLKALTLLPKIAESAGVEIVAVRKLLNRDSSLRLHTDQVSR
ncbi:MAG: divergent polysaccharide deacetylase family protein [Deltaproteobacteria bacterium]|nr:divergent polysaccharide deacetylase family protein [Deltaproteobacteria bacterium]